MRLKAIEGLTDELPETLAGPLGGLAQRRLEFGEGLFDRVEVWAVGRQIDELSALCSDRLGDTGSFVTGKIVEHDDVVGPQGWRQHLLDISPEALAVNGAVEDAGRGDPTGPQTGHQRRHLPMPVRHRGEQSQPTAGSAIAACHIGGGPSLVEEDQVVGIERWLAADEDPPRLDYVGAILLGSV